MQIHGEQQKNKELEYYNIIIFGNCMFFWQKNMQLPKFCSEYQEANRQARNNEASLSLDIRAFAEADE